MLLAANQDVNQPMGRRRIIRDSTLPALAAPHSDAGESINPLGDRPVLGSRISYDDRQALRDRSRQPWCGGVR